MNWQNYIDVVELEAISHECDIILYCEELDMDLDIATERFIRSLYGEVTWGFMLIRRADDGHWRIVGEDS